MKKLLILLVLFQLFTFADDRPNILFCISDDQSFAHTGANGDPVIKTPGFDRIAKEGIRFTNSYCDAPTCGPSRSAILTGQHIWRLEEAGNLWSTLPAKFKTYTELLSAAGYFVGSTGKGWSPGDLAAGGRSEQPAGKVYRTEFYGKRNLKDIPKPVKSFSPVAYGFNFKEFLKKKPKGKPFCFWLGTYEPHRGYEAGSGKKSGMDPSKVKVPGIFPDNEIVRNDILDYMLEVEHFDNHVNMAIKQLEEAGELENTIVIVTSDHGMPFPRAKASLYDWGTKVPLAIRWPKGIKNPGRVSHEFVNLSDIAPTLLEAAGVTKPEMMTGKSLMPLLKSSKAKHRDRAFIAMERHAGCREGGKGYPCRAIRTKDFLYIYNFDSNRWPAGDPDPKFCARLIPYGELDNSPTKDFMLENRDMPGVTQLANLAFEKRNTEELYRISSDPDQLKNLAESPEYESVRKEMKKQLFDYLEKTKDPRVTGGKVLWDQYPFYRKSKNNWMEGKE